MKKNVKLLAVLPMVVALTLPVAFAEDEAPVAETPAPEPEPAQEEVSYEAPEASTVVYDEPTVYYSSVVYQSAVVYNAPVYYIAAGAALAVSYAQQPQTPAEPEPPASTVIVVGGGTYHYNSPAPSAVPSQMIQFGQRGSSWFGR